MKLKPLLPALVLLFACSSFAETSDTTVTTAKVSLEDGSVIVGVPITDQLKFDFIFGDLALKVVDIARIQRAGTNTVKVALRNNDLLTGTPRFGELALKTTFGTVKPSIELVKGIAFTHDKGGSEAGLVLACGMESREEIEAAGGSFQNATFAEGVNGMAVALPGGKNPVEFLIGDKLPDVGRGCVEFRARILQPAWVEDGGQELNLAVLRPQSEPAHVYFRYTFTHNDGMGHGGLVGKCFDNVAFGTHPFGTPFRIRDIIDGDPAAWHHYTIAWDENGINGEPETMILFVDGKRICSSTAKPHVVRGTAWATGRTTLTIADPCTTPQSAVIIDDLKVWDRANLRWLNSRTGVCE